MPRPLAFVQQREISPRPAQRIGIPSRRAGLDLLAHGASRNERLEPRLVIKVAHNKRRAGIAHGEFCDIHGWVCDVIHDKEIGVNVVAVGCGASERLPVGLPVVEADDPARDLERRGAAYVVLVRDGDIVPKR